VQKFKFGVSRTTLAWKFWANSTYWKICVLLWISCPWYWKKY